MVCPLFSSHVGAVRLRCVVFPGTTKTHEFAGVLCVLGHQYKVWIGQFPFSELTNAITDFLRMHRFETTDTASKSLLVAEVFDRVLQLCPLLQLIAGDAHAMDACNAFRPMLASYDIPRRPLLEDWQALDLALVPLKDMLMDVGSGANKLISKVQLVIEDRHKEQAVSNMST